MKRVMLPQHPKMPYLASASLYLEVAKEHKVPTHSPGDSHASNTAVLPVRGKGQLARPKTKWCEDTTLTT